MELDPNNVLFHPGASAIIFWHKVKKKVKTTLYIDPNVRKEVEEDLVVIDEEVKAETNTETKKNRKC